MAQIYSIIVEGNISSGKSTLLNFLEQKYKGKVAVLQEPIHKWCNIRGFNLLVSRKMNIYSIISSLIQLTISFAGSVLCGACQMVFRIPNICIFNDAVQPFGRYYRRR